MYLVAIQSPQPTRMSAVKMLHNDRVIAAGGDCGHASWPKLPEILDWTDEDGTDVFRRFWMGRRILEGYRASHRRGETRICFLRITPDPLVSTYMVG
jgi:hypothetical protein